LALLLLGGSSGIVDVLAKVVADDTAVGWGLAVLEVLGWEDIVLLLVVSVFEVGRHLE
jgi:hypothetical protein